MIRLYFRNKANIHEMIYYASIDKTRILWDT